jgi:hypothetical protein
MLTAKIAYAKCRSRKETNMSKKHFIQLADFCRNQNPHFNRARFIDYINGNCGPCGGKR